MLKFPDPSMDNFDLDEVISNHSEVLNYVIQKVATETLAVFIKEVVDNSRDPVLALAQIGYACGIYSPTRGAEMARDFGISKQAFSKGAAKWGKKLNLRPRNACKSVSPRFQTLINQ